MCTDCVSVWQSPQEKDVKFHAENQRAVLCGHFIAINTVPFITQCNVICLFLCGCLSTDPVCYTVLRTHCSSQCVQIIGSNNYVHFCHMVDIIYFSVTVVMTKNFNFDNVKSSNETLRRVDSEMPTCYMLSDSSIHTVVQYLFLLFALRNYFI